MALVTVKESAIECAEAQASTNTTTESSTVKSSDTPGEQN
jgi:hypothetical protein